MGSNPTLSAGYVYILHSYKDENFFVGFSEVLTRRMAELNNGKADSSKHRQSTKSVCYEAYLHKEEAQKREKYLKSRDGRKELIIRLYKNNNIMERWLSGR